MDSVVIFSDGRQSELPSPDDLGTEHATEEESARHKRLPTVGAAWRALIMLKVSDMKATLGNVPVPGNAAEAASLRREKLAALELMNDAVSQAMKHGTLWSWWRGIDCDTAFRRAHVAEARTTALLPFPKRSVRAKTMLFDASRVLEPDDPVRKIDPDDKASLTPERTFELVRRYRSVWDDRYFRSHSYRNRLLVFTAIVLLFVLLLLLVASFGLFAVQLHNGHPAVIVGADQPQHFVLSRLTTMLALAAFGAVGGLLAATPSITRMGGTYNPFFLTWNALYLKVATGALTGILGVLLILGGFAPDISPSTWGEVVLWALVFGASQQAVTQIVDSKVRNLIASEPQQQQTLK